MSTSTSSDPRVHIAGSASTTGAAAGRHAGRAPETTSSPRSPAVKRRMLIIVNPYATTVSDRLRHLVVYALQGRFEVDAVDTEARGHATELCREAAHEGYDVVVAFGGDGTVNEAANGLLGLPHSAHAACPAARRTCSPRCSASRVSWSTPPSTCSRWPTTGAPRNGRRSGVRQRPLLHVRLRSRRRRQRRAAGGRQPAPEGPPRRLLLHVGRPRHVRPPLPRQPAAHAGARRRPHAQGVTAIVQNGSPFTYFQNRPIEIAEDADARLRHAVRRACCAAPRRCRCPRSPGARSPRGARVSRHRQVTRALREPPS